MGRPVCLFTGQWADLPLEKLAAKAQQWGFDGLELACWGDHFEVDKALTVPSYVDEKREMLADPRQRSLEDEEQIIVVQLPSPAKPITFTKREP